MRKGGILILITIVAFAGLFGFFFGEDYLELKIEQAVSSIFKANVEIDNFKLYRDPAISFDRLMIADQDNPAKNLIEIGWVGFFVEPQPLLSGKVIVNKMEITDVKFGTPRKQGSTKNRYSKSEWLTKIEKSLSSKIEAPPIGEFLSRKKLNPSEAIALFDLKSPGLMDSLELAINSTYKQALGLLQKFDRTTAGGSNANSESDKLLMRSFKQTSKQIKESFEIIGLNLNKADRQVNIDLSSLKSRTNPFKISPEIISKNIFGKPFVKITVEILRYVDLVRRAMPTSEELLNNKKIENPPRLMGQDIHFPIKNSLPDFFINELLVRSPSNQKEARNTLRVRGKIHKMNSQPGALGRLQEIELSVRYPNPRKYGVIGTIDHSQNIPWEQFQIMGSGIEMLNIGLPEQPFLPERIITERGKLSAGFELTGDHIEAMVTITGLPARFVFSETDGQTQAGKKISKALESIKRFSFGARLVGTPDNLELSLSSSIDKTLTKQFEQLLHRTLNLDRIQLHNEVDSILSSRKRELTDMLKKCKTEVYSKLSRHGV